MSDRAVSNTLGFIVIFSLVLFSIALISTAGIQGLQDTRDATMKRNAELSMQNVGNAFEDVYRDNESRRTASIRLGRGTLEPGAETSMTVTVGTSSPTTLDATFRPVRYRLDDTQIAYEGTSVVREQSGGAVFVREPSFVLDSDRVIVPIVNSTNATATTITGSTAQLELRRTGSRTHLETIGSTTDVQIEVDSTDRRERLWEDYLAPKMDSCSNSAGSPVTCELTLSAAGSDPIVVVRHVRIEYEIS